jgi:hypothetical protein
MPHDQVHILWQHVAARYQLVRLGLDLGEIVLAAGVTLFD